FLAAEPDIQELARDAGIGGRVVDQLTSGSSLWTGRRLEPLAEGQAAALLGIQGVSRSAIDCGFRSFATGMADLVEALIARVGPAIRPAQGVTGVAAGERGWRIARSGGPPPAQRGARPAAGDPGAISATELAAILGLAGSPLWTRVFHWPRGLPRYKPGHAEHVAAVRERLARLPPLAIAGAGFDGAGVSACVRSGRAAA